MELSQSVVSSSKLEKEAKMQVQKAFVCCFNFHLLPQISTWIIRLIIEGRGHFQSLTSQKEGLQGRTLHSDSWARGHCKGKASKAASASWTGANETGRAQASDAKSKFAYFVCKS